jgi:hypothetical protein
LKCAFNVLLLPSFLALLNFFVFFFAAMVCLLIVRGDSGCAIDGAIVSPISRLPPEMLTGNVPYGGR